MRTVDRAGRDARGVVAIVFAMALFPLMVAVGMAIDLARLVVAQTQLQAAVDSAALAGATAFRGGSDAAKAALAASQYFGRFPPGSGMAVGTPVITATPGFSAQGYTSYTVTVSASATLKTTIMSLARITSLNMGASATAANPIVQPIITVGPIGTDAADWNSVYMFAIPSDASGQILYSQMPTYSGLYEIATNCNSLDSNWTSKSGCNGKAGAVIPPAQTFPPISATQPLGFLFENMENGMAPPAGPAIYGAQWYNAQPGYMMLFDTAWVNSAPGVLSGNSPSYLTDSSATLMPSLTGVIPAQPGLLYTSKVNSTATPDCSLVIQPVDPNNVPSQWTFYSTSGQTQKCHATSESATGMEYANLSCAQMNGRTFMYWWNDMGGYPDDLNYIDLFYTVRCVPGSGNPNGGQLYQGNTVPVYSNLVVSLVQ